MYLILMLLIDYISLSLLGSPKISIRTMLHHCPFAAAVVLALALINPAVYKQIMGFTNAVAHFL